jgi:Family of unknown function (DUF6335)
MAKRKAARRQSASARRGASRGRSASRKAVSTRKAKKATKTARASTRRPAKAAPRKAVKASRKAAAARSATAKARTTARKAPARKAAARKTIAPAATPRSAPPARSTTNKMPVRTAPSLNRERRTIVDEEDVIPTPPSSLDLDRSASAVRTGRREMKERFEEHTETSPAMTGGDVDADWESAYSVGDEAPGGDNPTPDQDIVDDIGHAIGVEYQDNEELKGEAKISKRDRNRWELDPASSDDWDER